MSITRKTGEKCPDCGGDIIFMRIQAYDPGEGCDAIYYVWRCEKCNKKMKEDGPIHTASGRDPYDYPYDF